MTSVYIYNAELLCEDCGLEAVSDAKNAKQEDTGDSDDYPQGPYSDGGGEADCPQHCGHCHTFLENPLTTEGLAYVKERVLEHYTNGRGNGEVIAEWVAFYEVPNPFDDESEADR